MYCQVPPGFSLSDELVRNEVFWKISRFLDQILLEYVESIVSINSKLYFYSICSIRIYSRNRDIFEKPRQLISYPPVKIKSIKTNGVKIAARLTREQWPRSDLGVENAPGQDSINGTG